MRTFVTDIKQTVRISIDPQWARFYDFGAGGYPLSSRTSSTMVSPTGSALGPSVA